MNKSQQQKMNKKQDNNREETKHTTNPNVTKHTIWNIIYTKSKRCT